MQFEWNTQKNKTNILKHGIAFDDAMYIWEGWVLELPDPNDHGGEVRIRAFGIVDGRTLAVAYTWRGDVRRIISARKANKRERRAYHAALPDLAADP
jgi:uncharacterized DUF497 family protein